MRCFLLKKIRMLIADRRRIRRDLRILVDVDHEIA